MTCWGKGFAAGRSPFAVCAVRNCLLTGPPGIGKTTVVERILARLKVDAGGFLTREMREGGRRTGFEIVTLDGKRGILATVKGRSRYRVGRYRVNVEELERVALPALERARRDCELMVIDEIGTMELFSPRGFAKKYARRWTTISPCWPS